VSNLPQNEAFFIEINDISLVRQPQTVATSPPISSSYILTLSYLSCNRYIRGGCREGIKDASAIQHHHYGVN